ncbi:hypothetical protein ABVT39_016745 [Epinephelus coioides]
MASSNAEWIASMRDIIREEMSSVMNAKLKPLTDLMSSLKTKMQKCESTIGSLELFASKATDQLSNLKFKLEKSQERWEKENQDLHRKVDQLENQSRKCNIRVFRLENNLEAGNPTRFLNDVLYKIIGTEKLGPTPPVVVAHRTGKPHSVPCCMIAKLYSSVLKMLVTSTAASKTLMYKEK